MLKNFDILLAAAVFTAWVIDMLFLPAMVVLFKPFGSEEKRVQMKEAL
ncbi:MAG: hypothetical protein WAO76_16815 [Georgfuchsia sp.]